MRSRNKFEQARYTRQVFESKHPFPKYCGACYFLEDWDHKASLEKPTPCIDCSAKVREWYIRLDRFIEDYGKVTGLPKQ